MGAGQAERGMAGVRAAQQSDLDALMALETASFTSDRSDRPSRVSMRNVPFITISWSVPSRRSTSSPRGVDSRSTVTDTTRRA